MITASFLKLSSSLYFLCTFFMQIQVFNDVPEHKNLIEFRPTGCSKQALKLKGGRNEISNELLICENSFAMIHDYFYPTLLSLKKLPMIPSNSNNALSPYSPENFNLKEYKTLCNDTKSVFQISQLNSKISVISNSQTNDKFPSRKSSKSSVVVYKGKDSLGFYLRIAAYILINYIFITSISKLPFEKLVFPINKKKDTKETKSEKVSNEDVDELKKKLSLRIQNSIKILEHRIKHQKPLDALRDEKAKKNSHLEVYNEQLKKKLKESEKLEQILAQ